MTTRVLDDLRIDVSSTVHTDRPIRLRTWGWYVALVFGSIHNFFVARTR